MGIQFMGLKVADPSWSNQGFARFCLRLAAEIGVDLEPVENIGDLTPLMDDDPIIPFLAFLFDEEGDWPIKPEACSRVATRLRELVKDWPQDPMTEEGYDGANAVALAAFMDYCAAEKLTLTLL